MRHNPMFPPRSLAMLFSSSARLLYGAIRLTEAREYQMGSLTLRPTAPLPAVRDFVASFDVLIGGGEADAHDPARLGWWERGGEPLAGHGVSFCYADLSSAASSGEAFGERGPKGEHALCVSLLTHSSRLLEVTRGGEVRADRRGPQPLRTVTPPYPHPGGWAYPSPSDPPYAPLPPWHHHQPLAPHTHTMHPLPLQGARSCPSRERAAHLLVGRDASRDACDGVFRRPPADDEPAERLVRRREPPPPAASPQLGADARLELGVGRIDEASLRLPFCQNVTLPMFATSP